MSTTDAEAMKRLAALAAEKGVATLESPVTGGVHRAAQGDITILVGGDAVTFDAHRPALEAMGGEIFHMGPLGSASVIKVITNMLARSEEHTSELQSLMRISYAVFCLK